MNVEKKMKLSIKGGGAHLKLVWAGSGLLAGANAEGMVRFWHLEKDDNYVLSTADQRHFCDKKDVVQTLAFNPRKRVLSGNGIHH